MSEPGVAGVNSLNEIEVNHGLIAPLNLPEMKRATHASGMGMYSDKDPRRASAVLADRRFSELRADDDRCYKSQATGFMPQGPRKIDLLSNFHKAEI